MTLQERVAAGIEFLGDRAYNIDLDRLFMSTGSSCALAQAYDGDYYDVLDDLEMLDDLDWQIDHGFVRKTGGDWESWETWEALTDEWRRQLQDLPARETAA